MAKITDIQPQKKREGYFNIFVDNEYYCALSALSLSLAQIRIGDELTFKALNDLQKNAEFSKAYNRALYYLRFGPRTAGEMKRYLLEKEFSEKAVDFAVSQLEKDHYIDDKLYIENFVENRKQLKPRSMRQLRFELAKKHLDKDLVSQYLSEVPDDFELNAAKSVYEKKLKLAQYKDKTKMTQYLLRQGFQYSTVKQVINLD